MKMHAIPRGYFSNCAIFLTVYVKRLLRGGKKTDTSDSKYTLSYPQIVLVKYRVVTGNCVQLSARKMML